MRVELNKFADYIRFEKKYSSHTCSSYQNDLTQFRDFIEITYDFDTVDQISHLHIRGWMAELIQQKIAPGSINRKLSTLKSFYKFLMRSGTITENPLLKIQSVKTSKRLPDFVDEAKMMEVMNGQEFEDNYQGKLEKLIVEIFYQTGIPR